MKTESLGQRRKHDGTRELIAHPLNCVEKNKEKVAKDFDKIMVWSIEFLDSNKRNAKLNYYCKKSQNRWLA